MNLEFGTNTLFGHPGESSRLKVHTWPGGEM